MTKARDLVPYAPGLIVLAVALPAWWIDARLAWAAYLAAWWFCAGCVMGGFVNVWIHNLTGGAWGEAIRGPLLALGRAAPLLALLFIPVLLGKGSLYPWAVAPHELLARWAGELTRPEFKRAWLDPGFFVVRSVAYVGVWLGLVGVTLRPRWCRSRAWSAAALIVYALVTTLASIDWIMSLVPRWYSTTFGLLLATGQGLAGIACGIVAAAVRHTARRSAFVDLGNILLTYVLVWAYLAFTQYLIIWAENLPDEIAWYVPRLDSAWEVVAWVLIGAHFFVPLLVLLSRGAKSAPFVLGVIAAMLLVAHLVDIWWLTVPSVRPHSAHVLWFGPLAAVGLAALLVARVRQAWVHARESAVG